jgi:P27 family predicted phage terminase small subunit
MPTPALTPFEEHVRGRTSEAKAPAPSPYVAGRPKFPPHLSKMAKAEFKRVAGLLEQRRTLTEADGTALGTYARCWQRWVEAEKNVDDRGASYLVPVFDRNGNKVGEKEKTNPRLIEAAMLRKELLQHAAALGISPASREKVKQAASAKTETAPIDEAEEFFDNGPRLLRMPRPDESNEGDDE